jgi:ADP-heptose:LPS heptosyltransferase
MKVIMLNPKRILVTKFRAMGDTILLTAALKELHRNFPSAQIHVAATEPWIWLLDGFPGVTKLMPVTWHNDRAARTKAATRLAFQLRKENYDIVVGFHSSPAAAMVALSTGAKVRSIHFHSFKAKNMYSTVEIPGKGTVKPVVERDLDSIRALGLTVPEGVMPEIFLKLEEKSLAAEEFQSWGLKRPVLGVALGASRPTKIWPLHRYAEPARNSRFNSSHACLHGSNSCVSNFPIKYFSRKRFRAKTFGSSAWSSYGYAFWTRAPTRVASLSARLASETFH